MGKKDNNYIYENYELLQKYNLLRHTSSDIVYIQGEEACSIEEDKLHEDFKKLYIKIINSENKYLIKLQKDIEEANKYILYCAGKINSVYTKEKQNEIRTYYHSQIEKMEEIIKEKNYQINKIRKKISEVEKKLNMIE